MRILKVIARLLDYPRAEVLGHRSELVEAIAASREISPAMRAQLLDFLGRLCGEHIMDSQEAYGLLFDQGRSLSLHLFEHVHGESRDRGQAMVDLMAVYEENGFELDARELPDYLPLFLEYLATRSEIEVREWLADVSHILARLSARLRDRDGAGSDYGLLIEALLVIAGQRQLLQEACEEVSGEAPDNTPEAIDQEWEETAVTFGAPDKSCGLNQKPEENPVQPLHWVDAAAPSQSETGSVAS